MHAPTMQKLAILVGGGPAPGINAVIGATTIRARLQGIEVLGVRGGFSRLMRGDASAAAPLGIEEVSRIHFLGGSHLGTSRANPTRDPAHLDAVVRSLAALGVNQLVTIGGDDTAFSAMKVAAAAGASLQVAHVPKTIDNDLSLPAYVDTFGFQTARHLGVDLVKNLMVDARTTGRWYFVVAMGRKAGHLALGIAKAAGATLALIPEEFQRRPVSVAHIVDSLAGAVIKRRSEGHPDGVAVLAEGLTELLSEDEQGKLGAIAHDEHGHIRLAELDLGRAVRIAVTGRLESLGVNTSIVSKDIGYELRCADPIPFDIDYARDLGYCAAKFLIEGGSGAMVSMQGGQFVAIPFPDLLDPATGRTRVRTVEIHSTRYAIARRYMIRLRRDDFDNPQKLERLAASVKLAPEEFARQFAYVVEDEPPALALRRA
ncbi:MAG: 6-phosphofructokinase [Burkholderiales bacterium]|nr:6-phosphofructokinase [Burkholderiales bacterium]